jgi:hypothetical protein
MTCNLEVVQLRLHSTLSILSLKAHQLNDRNIRPNYFTDILVQLKSHDSSYLQSNLSRFTTLVSQGQFTIKQFGNLKSVPRKKEISQ